MKTGLKLASLLGVGMGAAMGTVMVASVADAQTPAPPPAAVYTQLSGQPAAVVPVYYKCTKRRGCGYYFYRKYGEPVVYTYPDQIGGIPVLGALLTLPGTIVNGATNVAGAALAVPGTILTGTAGAVGATAGAVGATTTATADTLIPALSLGLLR